MWLVAVILNSADIEALLSQRIQLNGASKVSLGKSLRKGNILRTGKIMWPNSIL